MIPIQIPDTTAARMTLALIRASEELQRLRNVHRREFEGKVGMPDELVIEMCQDALERYYDTRKVIQS